MSKIEEMLKQLCPEGVERVQVGSLCMSVTNVQWRDDKRSYRYIDLSSVDRETHLIGATIEIAAEDAPSRAQQIVRTGDVLFATTRPTQMRLCFVPNAYDGQICSTGYVVLRPNVDILNPRWIYYQLCGNAFCHYCERNQIQGGAYPSITNGSVKAFEIPFPPRPVQDEIVKALDAMDAAVKALEEERAVRQEQFEAVRERSMKVLASKQDLLHSLSEICSIKNGGDYKSFGPGPYPVYGSGGVMTHVDHYAYDKPSVLLPRKGSIDRIYYIEKPFWNVDTIYYTMINEGVWPKYFYHYMTTVSMARYNKAGGVPSLTQGDWNRQFVPIPAFAVQKKIAAQLDAFAAVVTALDEEIAARREQFAGWLEKLMTFKMKEVAVA